MRKYVLSAAVVACALPGMAASATQTFFGYTGNVGLLHGAPRINGDPVGLSAADARSGFLNALGNSYFYEDFQGQTVRSGTTFNSLPGNQYALTFNGHDTGAEVAPSATLSTDKIN